MFGIRQETGQQQNGLTRHWQAGTLEQQQSRHGPVSVVHHRAPQQLDDLMSHEVDLSSIDCHQTDCHQWIVILRERVLCANEGSRRAARCVAFFATHKIARLARFLIAPRSGRHILVRQKVNQLPVELLWTFFIGQVSDTGENNHLGIWKMFRQRRSR